MKQRPKSLSATKQSSSDLLSNPFNNITNKKCAGKSTDVNEVPKKGIKEKHGRANSFGECFAENSSRGRRLVKASEAEGGASFRQQNKSEAAVTLNHSKRVSKLNPVLLQLDSSVNNCSELPLDLSLQSIEKPEPEKSDSMYDRLIHLNMKEKNGEEIRNLGIEEDNPSRGREELVDAMDESKAQDTSEDSEAAEDRVDSLKKLLNQKYVESKQQSHTFVTDSDVKSVAALSIIPSRSFNLSACSLTNIHSGSRNGSDTQLAAKANCKELRAPTVKESNARKCSIMKKSFSGAQNLVYRSGSGSVAGEESAMKGCEGNKAEDITSEVMNATSKTDTENSINTNISEEKQVLDASAWTGGQKRCSSNADNLDDSGRTLRAGKDTLASSDGFRETRKTRNEVRSLYNFVKHNYNLPETLSYDIEKNSNEFYGKIMEDASVNSSMHNALLRDKKAENGSDLGTRSDAARSLQERIHEISRELRAEQGRSAAQ